MGLVAVKPDRAPHSFLPSLPTVKPGNHLSVLGQVRVNPTTREAMLGIEAQLRHRARECQGYPLGRGTALERVVNVAAFTSNN